MELIISHSNCDFDGFASMLAATLLYPGAKMCLVGSVETNLRHFLERYQNKFEFIKEKNVEATEITKLIVVDNRDPSRMGKISELFKRSEETKKPTIIVYDHHPDSPTDIKSDYAHIDFTGASITIMLDFLNRAGIQISPFYASIFALGIYEDTGNFLNANTTGSDFAAMSLLFSLGASIELIKEYLIKDFTSDQLQVMNEMLSNSETISLKGVELTFTEITITGFKDDIAFLLQTVKRSRNLKLVFCLLTTEEKIQVIGRNDYAFIFLDKIMQALGGGGHKTAAFASIKQRSGSEIKEMIVAEINKQISEYGLAAEVMTTPVDLVDEETTLNQARMILINRHYSTLLIGQDNQIKGILTKKDISRAIHHQMGERPVKSCMSTNVITVKENESAYIAYKTMIDFNIGRIPVTDQQGEVKGIITRSDILHYQYYFNEQHSDKTERFANIKSLMLKHLDTEVIDILKKAGFVADSIGMKALVVGGFVRDLLMNRRNYDLDIVIEGNGLVFAQEFKNRFGKRIKSFPTFGTAYVVMKDGRKIDVATARTEFYAESGSLPSVEYSSIRNDLYRRDFTINSLAVRINPKDFGTLLDHFGGRRDIRRGVIRVLNNLSFVEDPIRILRAIRFEQRFGFRIDEKTQHLMANSLTIKSLANVSVERIRAELVISCNKGTADTFFTRLDELGILKQININLIFTTKKRALSKKISELIIWFNNSFPDERIERWLPHHLVLVHDLSTRIQLKIANQLKYPLTFSNNISKLAFFLENYDNQLFNLKDEGEIALILRKLSSEAILFLLALIDDLGTRDKLTRYLSKSRFIKPILNGHDLIALGIPEGKKIGDALDGLWKAKINSKLPDQAAEERFIKSFIDGTN